MVAIGVVETGQVAVRPAAKTVIAEAAVAVESTVRAGAEVVEAGAGAARGCSVLKGKPQLCLAVTDTSPVVNS